MLVAGVDVGAATAKAAVMRDGELVGWAVQETGGFIEESALDVTEKALAQAGATMDQLDFVCSTGYARKSIPFSQKAISEILCHAKGVSFLHPDVRTIIDIGGQDSKVISVLPGGKVDDFAMNDKCAAGTGRFFEVMAKVLELDVDEMGEEALKSDNPIKFKSACTTFIETEIMSYRSEGARREDMVSGITHAVARRVGNMAGMMGFKETIAFTGGVARNVAVARYMEKQVGKKILVPEHPQLMGAFGAAIFAQENCARVRSADVL